MFPIDGKDAIHPGDRNAVCYYCTRVYTSETMIRKRPILPSEQELDIFSENSSHDIQCDDGYIEVVNIILDM